MWIYLDESFLGVNLFFIIYIFWFSLIHHEIIKTEKKGKDGNYFVKTIFKNFYPISFIIINFFFIMWSFMIRIYYNE